MKVKSLSRVRLFATPWTKAHQAPPSMGFSRQEYWSGVPLPSPTVCIGLSKYTVSLTQLKKTISMESLFLPSTPVLLPRKSHGRRRLVGCSPWGHSQTGLSDFTFTFHFHALEKDMATHSSVLAWRIPGTGEPDGLPSMGLHRVRHD